MPYLTREVAKKRPRSFQGLGASPTDSRHGTPEEWAAYHSRIQWRRTKAQTGPRDDEWRKQATWSAAALQKLIAGESVTVKPFPADPELLAIIVNGRAWLLTLEDWQLYELFPGLTAPVLAQARRILLPGADVVAIARAKVVSDIARLEKDERRLKALQAESVRYLKFAEDTLKQFQTYANWFKRHLEKKAKKTEIIGHALSAVAAALYWVPVVGWALGAIVDAANIAYQLDQMKAQIAAMQAAGARVEAARVYVALMEALGVTLTELDNALGAIDWQLYFQRAQLEALNKIGRPAVGGAPQPAGVAPPSGKSSPTAVPDTSIVRALSGEAGKAFRKVLGTPGKLLVAGVVAAGAALLAFGRRRRG